MKAAAAKVWKIIKKGKYINSLVMSTGSRLQADVACKKNTSPLQIITNWHY